MDIFILFFKTVHTVWWWCTVLLFKPTIPLLGVWFSWCEWPWQSAPVLQLYHHHHEQDGHGHAGGRVWCWKTTGQGVCASTSPSQQNQTIPIITNLCLLPLLTTWSCRHTEPSSRDPSIHHQGWDDRCWGSRSEAGRQRDSHKGAQEVSQDQGNTNELPNSPPNKENTLGLSWKKREKTSEGVQLAGQFGAPCCALQTEQRVGIKTQ